MVGWAYPIVPYLTMDRATGITPLRVAIRNTPMAMTSAMPL